MDGRSENIDEICETVRSLIRWVNPLERAPVVYAGANFARMATRARPFLEFGFQASGPPVEFRVGDLTTTSEPGALMALNAHFGNGAAPGEPWRYWCLSFDVGAIEGFRDWSRNPRILWTRLSSSAWGDVEKSYRAIVAARRNDGPLADARLKKETLAFLFGLIDRLSGEETEDDRPLAIRKAIDFIGERYGRHDLALADLASAAGLSRIHFGRTFKRATGVTPMRYLTEFRLERAKELLDRSDLFIGEIGQRVGFDDRLHFSRVFKKLVGISPRGFREKSC